MIEIEAKQLRAAAAEVAHVAGGGGDGAPILSNVLLVADGPSLRLRTTDLDTAIDHVLTLTTPGTLRTTVSAKLLATIAGKLPAEAKVTLEGSAKGKLSLSAGRARFELATLPADDFPDIPDAEWVSEFELAGDDLGALIDSIGFAVSADETRYYLNGIYFHAVGPAPGAGTNDEGEMLLRAAATDGHRLARYQLPLPDGAAALPAGGVILPRRALSIIRKMCDAAGEEKVQLAFSEARMRIEAGETVLTAQLIDGTFPDYTRVIPTANERKLQIDRAGLFEAVERVATIVSDKSRAISCDLEDDKALLKVQSPEYGTATEEVPAGYAAEALTIGFNARYLLEVLGKLKGGNVHLELGDAAAPVLLRDPDCDRQLFVIMPLRV